MCFIVSHNVVHIEHSTLRTLCVEEETDKANLDHRYRYGWQIVNDDHVDVFECSRVIVQWLDDRELENF